MDPRKQDSLAEEIEDSISFSFRARYQFIITYTLFKTEVVGRVIECVETVDWMRASGANWHGWKGMFGVLW